ncbi:TPA: hypothetical protein N0F65_002180 [Lagenidium giganteum]|uniref:Uncharacterized protein n=1 Tax=Lagenidium giganteum TaxID=4803 RepID=A0AAV2YKK5_9STRA|nr:TPA: hypothetical protein N0F65_002180 [Lagenidium giganteum]
MQTCFASLLRVRSASTKSHFWKNLMGAEKLIAPLATASHRLQCDETTLAEVVYSFQQIFRAFKAHVQHADVLVKCVEGRWDQARLTKVTLISSCSAISDFAVYYHRRFIGEDYSNLRDEIEEWLNEPSISLKLTDYRCPALGFW